MTFIAHYLKKRAKIYIIGVGGGRDIAAAYLFGQKKIIGAEVNWSILNLLLRGKYAAFTGHLDKIPGVKLIEGEARSTLTTLPEKFDIIQASCIATWSATTAGAFSLAENSLYTTDAWKVFYKHLTQDGIISFNRWFSRDYPAQLLRLTSIAAFTLKSFGIKDPGKHIVIVRNDPPPWRWASATILVKKSPFNKQELETLDRVCKSLKFIVVFSPLKRTAMFQSIIDNVNNPSYFVSLPLDISPISDDRPYFFQMLRLKDAFNKKKLIYKEQRFNLIGVQMLVVLLLISTILALFMVMIPPIIYARKYKSNIASLLARNWISLLFFALIGIAFMLFEISFIQRLVVFLGHPSYSMTVVLFSLLLSTGLGAFTCDRWIKASKKKKALFPSPMILLVLVLFIVYLATPHLVEKYILSSKVIRIIASLFILIPSGFFMGFAFPLGMSLALEKEPEQGPWLWAVNGGASVVASVIATSTSISYGINFTLKMGLITYIFATIVLFSMSLEK